MLCLHVSCDEIFTTNEACVTSSRLAKMRIKPNLLGLHNAAVLFRLRFVGLLASASCSLFPT